MHILDDEIYNQISCGVNFTILSPRHSIILSQSLFVFIITLHTIRVAPFPPSYKGGNWLPIGYELVIEFHLVTSVGD